MKTNFSFSVLVAALLVLASSAVFANTITTYQIPNIGAPVLGSYTHDSFQTINLANLNVHFTIPILSKAGAGGGFFYNLSYDSLVWATVTTSTESGSTTTWAPMPNMGWRSQTQMAVGYFTMDLEYLAGCHLPIFGNFEYHDPTGTAHPFSNAIWQPCSGTFYAPTQATDNSGYTLKAVGGFDDSVATIITSSGGVLTVPIVPSLQPGNGAGSIVDPNGNQIQTPDGTHFYDSSGSVVLTATGGTNGANLVLTYKAPGAQGNGVAASVTISYASYTVQTNFGIPGIGEYYSPQQYLVNKITLPDGSNYQFTYEKTNGSGSNVTGRIAWVKLPTGGVISYFYTNLNCYNTYNCIMKDGSPSFMTIEYEDGAYTYSRGYQNGTDYPQQTNMVVVDARNNETDLNFSGIYETARSVYKGRKTSDLDYTVTCYNGNTNPGACENYTVNPPIARQDVYDYPGNGTSIKYHTYDQYGNLYSEQDVNYDGTTLKKTVIDPYTSLCGISTYICDLPLSVQIFDGAGTSKSYTKYAYNAYGNVTSIERSPTGSIAGPFLTQQYSYNTNGTLNTATDPRGTLTTYSYGDNNHSCNQAFPNSVTVGWLTTSTAYNCIGGVVTLVTDSNGQITSTSYSDPDFWRPATITDALGNITYYNYYNVANNPASLGGSQVSIAGQTESVSSWSGSKVDVITTLDDYGRLWLKQQLNPQGTYDNMVENYYDYTGLLEAEDLPYTVQFAGPRGSGGITTTNHYMYDTLGRVTDIYNCAPHESDCHGPTTTYSYNGNDVGIYKGSGQTFGKQLEYDALGRLTSVCETTGASGHDCGQNTPQTGYRTTYTYDPLGDLTGVTQGVQRRSYSYDGLSRMTAETNPESGTTNYYFDSIGPGYCPAGANNQPGDLVVKTDANGNNNCYYYDGLHRLTDVGNSHQNGNNLCHRFRYDNSTGYRGDSMPAGVSGMSNPMGHLVQAVTDNCGVSGDWFVTDEWFSYSPRGEITDVWESPPDLGGWYHVQESYFANGAMKTLQGFNGTGTSTPFSDKFIYGLDTEGRPYSMGDNAPTGIWNSTAYSAANQPTSVQHPGGGETFAYEPYEGKMQQWQSTAQSTAGTQQQTGILSWTNTNGYDSGTLQKLQIIDTYNYPHNNQTCTYAYDDLARLSSALCSGSPGFAQTYSYDQYGNITTSGSFSPIYSQYTNKVNNLGFGYDADGDVTQDNEGNTFTYDVYNRPVVEGATTKVFDATGRIMELHNATSYTEIVYAPDGKKFAYMNGQTLYKYMDPMVAGMLAVHNHAASGDYGYFVHTDWLGSSRLGVTGAGAVEYDRAYAPFGAPYVEINNDSRDNRSFTGQNEDTTAGIYDFEQRQESQNEGRWFVPDPAGLSAVDITNPQTWNRYAYVGNQPLTNVDPLGLSDGCTADACVVAPPPPDVPTLQVPFSESISEFPGSPGLGGDGAGYIRPNEEFVCPRCAGNGKPLPVTLPPKPQPPVTPTAGGCIDPITGLVNHECAIKGPAMGPQPTECIGTPTSSTCSPPAINITPQQAAGWCEMAIIARNNGGSLPGEGGESIDPNNEIRGPRGSYNPTGAGKGDGGAGGFAMSTDYAYCLSQYYSHP